MAIDIHANPYKQDFPLLANHPEIVFLDSAATAQRSGSGAGRFIMSRRISARA